MTERQIILKRFEPKFTEASLKGLWFLNHHNPSQFLTPTEMKTYLNKHKYVIDPDSWGLISPMKRIQEIEKDIAFAHQEIEDLFSEREKILERSGKKK